ncbi:hypothetical protein LTR17_015898 [Elasticomyces elasticus]|nr:hypothetical protein LTR17_015898 [Elasticomyces elasticus]
MSLSTSTKQTNGNRQARQMDELIGRNQEVLRTDIGKVKEFGGSVDSTDKATVLKQRFDIVQQQMDLWNDASGDYEKIKDLKNAASEWTWNSKFAKTYSQQLDAFTTPTAVAQKPDSKKSKPKGKATPRKSKKRSSSELTDETEHGDIKKERNDSAPTADRPIISVTELRNLSPQRLLDALLYQKDEMDPEWFGTSVARWAFQKRMNFVFDHLPTAEPIAPTAPVLNIKIKTEGQEQPADIKPTKSIKIQTEGQEKPADIKPTKPLKIKTEGQEQPAYIKPTRSLITVLDGGEGGQVEEAEFEEIEGESPEDELKRHSAWFASQLH